MTYYVEEVTHLASYGETPERIAQRLGIQPGSVAQALKREGRPDLAAPFWAERARHRPTIRDHQCADCGAPITRHARARCKPCGYKARNNRKATAA